jgi:3-deoxy-D-manno-octulosonic-acid transferase
MALFGHKLKALLRGQRATLSKENRARMEGLHGAVWIHAASVGEFEQARPLIERIVESQKSKDNRLKIVVTFFSPSGYEARKDYPLADGVFYLPLPTRLNARRFLEALQPKMAIFIKYEFWPAYIRELHKRKIPVYSICAIFRPTQRFFHWYGIGALRLLKQFTHIFVQDEDSRALLTSHGVQHVSLAGDTRFDRVKQVQSHPCSKDLSPAEMFVNGCERVIVAGSTWPEDEQLLAQYMANDEQLTANGQQPKLILVPHEIDEAHLHFIFNLFQGRLVKYSAVTRPMPAISRQNILQQADVLLVDTIGLLSSIYRFGQVAYIGGGFGVGIHNTIEAAVYGMPVIFGPEYRNFREAKGLIAAGAARSIKNYGELEAALNTALEQHGAIGAKAAEYVQSELGATNRIYNAIFKI